MRPRKPRKAAFKQANNRQPIIDFKKVINYPKIVRLKFIVRKFSKNYYVAN